MASFTLTVNGARQVVNVAADMPLLYVLRNELQLSSVRLGCGISQCGACSVLADGKETRSCTMPISRVGNMKIHTIEGLPGLWAAKKGLTAAQASNTLHPVQQAWIDVQVPQCGYCQSGMMITAADLLTRIATPSVAQIKDAYTNPSPHLCRCGTYPAIVEAVQRAAKAMVSA
jgi:isoquinoline 1-oxidoreductase alpha subunit